MRQMYLNQQLQMQTQLRQLLAQLKQREGFSDLTPQEQQEVLVQHYISSQQMQRQLHPNIPQEQPAAANHMVQFVPLVAANSTPLIAQTVSSIWDLNGGVMTASTLEEIQRQEQERREADEKQRKLIDEQRRRNEEEEHRRRLEELQRKLEEERKRKEEILRKQDEERRMKEEEERVRIEEERRKRDDEKRRLEEQQRRQEEIKRLEELSRKQREEEIEKRRREAEEAERVKQLQEIERQRKLEADAIRQEQEEVYKRLQEQKKAWGTQSHSQMSAVQSTVSLVEIQRLQEQKEREERLKQAQLQQNMQALFQVQQAQQKQSVTKQQLTWANTNCQNVPVKTLAEIQKEEAERAAKQKQLDDQKNLQQGTVTNAGIWSNAASQLSWKNSTAWDNVSSTSKSSAGFWESETPFVAIRKSSNKSNESAFQPSNKGSCNHSNTKSNSSSRSRKDEVFCLIKCLIKFLRLRLASQEVVMKLFENQRRQQNDEFTQWCIDSLEKFQSFIDSMLILNQNVLCTFSFIITVPTFVAFLKDVEPAYEVTDYIKSYLGESKETREFAKNFVEKRSFYRNQAKKEASEELMWGPAPAITPSVNKSASVSSGANVATGDTEATIFTKSGKKKKKGKKVDNSILGFTVQADPDRVNVGEIEQIND
ncbi:PERQ amino acid-rich with GYF domain-containing protein-like protein [Leptotrombidium deliense]|uniref:PERQ amino acid-rich with GYF domain-containing protein-like protein n=1 Tax=Leptotrombidium deliense TaxID=299467 RepID=A0A443SQ29_9ACAR|nr:PERQ amino acid-rich with GYF domain-containing protein-like protein [Leptotrombidium deliense]